MEVFRYVNSILNSNTYILSSSGESTVFVIDPGDVNPILTWLEMRDQIITGIILTHSHYDHIYGLNDLISAFPDLKLYVRKASLSGLFCEKVNLSVYFDRPFVLQERFSDKFILLNTKSVYSLWNCDVFSIIDTPGHSIDSISILFENFLFCGDALIPGIKVYRVKGSVVGHINRSIKRICSIDNPNLVLLPGHGELCYLKDLSLINGFSRIENVCDVHQVI